MTVLEFMWQIAKYSVFGVKLKVNTFPTPIEVTGVNVRNLEFETPDGARITPTDFTSIQMYLYPLDYLSGDDLLRYQAWSRPPAAPESQKKFLERINNIEKFLCSRHIDYLDLISIELAIDATGKNIYGNME